MPQDQLSRSQRKRRLPRAQLGPDCRHPQGSLPQTVALFHLVPGCRVRQSPARSHRPTKRALPRVPKRVQPSTCLTLCLPKAQYRTLSLSDEPMAAESWHARLRHRVCRQVWGIRSLQRKKSGPPPHVHSRTFGGDHRLVFQSRPNSTREQGTAGRTTGRCPCLSQRRQRQQGEPLFARIIGDLC